MFFALMLGMMAASFFTCGYFALPYIARFQRKHPLIVGACAIVLTLAVGTVIVNLFSSAITGTPGDGTIGGQVKALLP